MGKPIMGGSLRVKLRPAAQQGLAPCRWGSLTGPWASEDTAVGISAASPGAVAQVEISPNPKKPFLCNRGNFSKGKIMDVPTMQLRASHHAAG